MDGIHLILKEWSVDKALQDIDFLTTTFFIQVHGLPPKLLHQGVALKIGQQFGGLHDKSVNWRSVVDHRFLSQQGRPTVEGETINVNLVVEKARENQCDIANLRTLARRGAEPIASIEIHRRRQFRELDLHGMEDDLAIWLNIGSDRVHEAVGLGRPKAIITLRHDGLYVDLIEFGPGEEARSKGLKRSDIPRIEEVALKLQSSSISPIGFMHGKDTSRDRPSYFTRSSRRRQWRLRRKVAALKDETPVL
ncbi:hypothetical protein FNV43_RR08630 [Rhamnella rubrinervis]|uniref:Uncharacterized protein n=1 Tax=Rhamnella rubrinervis TaxID=2594499 RepID=A0A8K0MJF5_9ROSA|nr:hypothetical protein FNV43_RR08630 [Rhamnella rubrinervis]